MVERLTGIRDRLRLLRLVRVDPLTDLLAGPRARGASTLRAQFEPPWSIDVQDDAPLTVVAVLSGTARLRLRHGDADEPLQPGDVAVVQGAQRYVVSDGKGTAPTVRILPGNRLRGPGRSPGRGVDEPRFAHLGQRRQIIVATSVVLVLGGVGLGAAEAYHTDDDDPPVDTGTNQKWVPPADEDPSGRLPTSPPEVDLQHDKPDTRAQTIAEAQALYDPENDPYTLVGKAPDGTFFSISVAMPEPPPDWVKTVEDLRAWQAHVAPQ